MSIARVYTTKGPVRKDGLKCGKCGDPIRKGIDRRRTFAVGFRGWEQTRCMKPECTPTRGELESSAVATVYDAADSIEFDQLSSLEDLAQARDDVVAALSEVADEYEGNEMYEINYDLQERAEMLRAAESELESWAPENDEPSEDDPDSWEVDGNDTGDFETAHDVWLAETQESLQEAIEGLELP